MTKICIQTLSWTAIRLWQDDQYQSSSCPSTPEQVNLLAAAGLCDSMLVAAQFAGFLHLGRYILTHNLTSQRAPSTTFQTL